MSITKTKLITQLRSGTNYQSHFQSSSPSPSPAMADEIQSDEEYYNTLDNLFAHWKQIVNSIVLHNYGMGCDDIPDFPYYDLFLENISQHEMFQIIDNNML